jgi:hypothetical protein
MGFAVVLGSPEVFAKAICVANMACVVVFFLIPRDALFGLFLIGNGLCEGKEFASAILENTFGEGCYGGFAFWHNNSFPNLTCKGTKKNTILQISMKEFADIQNFLYLCNKYCELLQ